jgi:NADPH-dependent curcumin reductase CurA
MATGWALVSRPEGVPTAENFTLHDIALPSLDAGMVRVQNRWLSVDPAMRVRMIDMASYVAPFEIGEILAGPSLGRVVESRSDALPVGTLVKHQYGWRDEVVAPAGDFIPLASVDAPEIAFMGPLGGTGMTACVGLFDIAGAKAGETVFVTGAAGAVGSIVVQIAKAHGLTVIASAGGPEKCAWVQSIGADAVIDYKARADITQALRAAAPDGIDICFDNVGGHQLDAALAVAKDNARFALCGMIAAYQDRAPLVLTNALRILTARISMRGFLVLDYPVQIKAHMAQMARMIGEGTVRPRETVFEGLASMPEAFIGLFSGRNFGKALVKLPAAQA